MSTVRTGEWWAEGLPSHTTRWKHNTLAQIDSLMGSYARSLTEVTVTKNGTQKYPSVTILSERPTSTGRVVKGKSGQGVIMADEPDVVYVTSLPKDSPQWYGHWPINETDLAAVIRKQRTTDGLKRYVQTDDARVYDTYTGRVVPDALDPDS